MSSVPGVQYPAWHHRLGPGAWPQYRAMARAISDGCVVCRSPVILVGYKNPIFDGGEGFSGGGHQQWYFGHHGEVQGNGGHREVSLIVVRLLRSSEVQVASASGRLQVAGYRLQVTGYKWQVC